GHQLDGGAFAQRLVEAHLVADHRAELAAQLLGDAGGRGARGDAARLRMADAALAAAPHLEQELRQLGGLARTGLAADDDHRVALDRGADVVAPRADRKRRIEADAAQASMRST